MPEQSNGIFAPLNVKECILHTIDHFIIYCNQLFIFKKNYFCYAVHTYFYRFLLALSPISGTNSTFFFLSPSILCCLSSDRIRIVIQTSATRYLQTHIKLTSKPNRSIVFRIHDRWFTI